MSLAEGLEIHHQLTVSQQIPWLWLRHYGAPCPQQHTRQRKKSHTYLPASRYPGRRLTENSMAANVRSAHRHHRQRRRSRDDRELFPLYTWLGAGSASGRMSGTRMNKSPLERRSKPKLAAAECAGRLIG